jgi:ATP-binding cassette, subfamily F, member 3
MLQVSNLSKEFSSRILFEGVNFTIGAGEKVSLVGRNGMGKSTLFKIIIGTENKSSGDVSIPKQYRLSYLEQHIDFQHPTLIKECMSVLSQELQYEEFRAEKVLFGLGFTDEDLEKDPKSFSGGFQLRINLTKAIIREPDLLLLDEPTNYLDIESIRWLKRFLKNLACEMLIISHDRDFLDAVCTHTMGIYRENILKVKGDTKKYYTQLAEEEEMFEKTRANQDKKIKEMERFVERFKAKASKATQAQSRVKQLEKMEVLTQKAGESNIHLHFNYAQCPAKYVLELDDISFSYPNTDIDLIKNLNLTLKADDKVAIIGKNGRGKSTLLNLIAGELSATSGLIKSHAAVKYGFFGQTNISRLSENNTVVDEVVNVGDDITYEHARRLCGAMLFRGDDVEKKIKVLSGGEKSRVLLAQIMARSTNILLLDEPTNHLDQESIEELLDRLNDFPGAAVIVVHSEYILKRFANKLIVFKNGEINVFNGTYDEFLRKEGWDDEIIPNQKSNKTIVKITRKEYRIRRQQLVKDRSLVTNPLKKTIEVSEEKIIELEDVVDALNTQLIVASENSDGGQVSTLSQKLASVQENIEQLFFKMEQASIELDTQNDEFEDKLSELDEMV